MGDNMLAEFTVSNYRNFSSPITIDFSKVHDYAFNKKNCVRNGLLSKAIIYGPNASGKSNFGYALFDIVGVLTDKERIVYQKDHHSFLNADTSEKTAKFKYVFYMNEDTKIIYSYEKTNPDTLYSESMQVNDSVVFSYDFSHSKFIVRDLNSIDAGNLNFEYYENNMSILRYIANNTNQLEGSVVKFIMNFVSNMLWFRCLQENGYIGVMKGSESIDDFIIRNGLVKEFQSFLFEMADISVELEVASPVGENKAMLIEKHKRTPLSFSIVSSSGTNALKLLFYWSKRFDSLSFLFMDEFDAFYHFALARKVMEYIVKLNNVQAVFTTHNSYLASNEILRPDCYFVLDHGKLVSFADSTDRELREGHNIEKLLRGGEFQVGT